MNKWDGFVRWLKKHYRPVCGVFLLVVLVGWTAFINRADRLAATADDRTPENSGIIDVASGKGDSEDSTGNASGDSVSGETVDRNEPESGNVPAGTVVSGDDGTDSPDVTEPGDGGNDPEQPEPVENTDIENGTDTEGSGDDAPDTDVPGPDGADDTPGVDEPGPDSTDDTQNAGESGPDNTDGTQNADDTEVEDGTNAITFRYAIANVESRLNIRSGAGTDYSNIAYLMPMGYCEVLEWGSEWTKIKSGSITGYVYTMYLQFNEEAVTKLLEQNKLFIRVTSNTVNIRSQSNTDSTILGKGTNGSKYVYVPDRSVEGWYCIRFSEDTYGYITEQYSEIFIDTSTAVPLS